MTSRRHVLGLAVAGIGSIMFSSVQAQAKDWPSHAIKIIVPYPTAGVSDTIIRILAERLALALGESIIVENRAGAGGTLGMDIVS